MIIKWSRDIKFVYSENATKFEKILFEVMYLVASKQIGGLFLIFQAFSDFMNFKSYVKL